MLPASNSSPELMQLGESEAFRALNQHYGGVGNVYAHFNHRRCDQYVESAVAETPQNGVLVPRVHPSVKQANPQIGEHLARQPLVFVSGGPGFDAGRFFNERANHEGLPSFLYLLANKPVCGFAVFGGHQPGAYRLTAGWEFVNGGNVQVAIQGERQGARNGCGGHYERVGILAAPAAQGRTLHHPETVLLVGNRQSQVGKRNALLNQGLSTDRQVQCAIGRHRRQHPFLPRPDTAGQQADGNRAFHPFQGDGKHMVLIHLARAAIQQA